MLYQFKGIKEGHIWVLQMRAMYHDVCKNKTFLTSMNVTVVRNPLFECFVNLNITQRFHSCTLRSNNYWYSLLQCTYISKYTYQNQGVFFVICYMYKVYSISLTKIVLRHNYFDLIDSINTMMPLSIWSLWTYSLMLDSNDRSLRGVDLMFIFFPSQKK